jgi:DNA-binding MarR family transcriptional regulator
VTAVRRRKHRTEVKLWLRLLACENLVVARLRRGLREEFGMTLPAFDLLAQIDRPPRGPTMSELSQRLMVSKGHVTDLVERLEGKGLIERRADPSDGRVQRVHLTPEGVALFARMAPAHNRWLAELMGGMAPEKLERLHELLGELKEKIQAV